jgi:hypothetical protein
VRLVLSLPRPRCCDSGRCSRLRLPHVAVDDHSRLAYIEVHRDEKEPTCALFLHRAATWFHDQHNVRILRVLTDNALAYRRGSTWTAVCVALGIRRRFTKPGCPWTNCEGVITPVPGLA